jgi:uncharacterized protein (TIGR00297 family)
MPTDFWLVFAILIIGMIMSVAAGKLTISGALTGGLLGGGIFLGGGYPGLAMLGIFFILGSAATSWKLKTKQSLGLAEINKGRRTASQAFANAGVAAAMGILAWVYPPQAPVFRLMLAAAFAAAIADTLSSELGNVYGRRFYNILTLQKDTRGLNGVISLEGTCFGLIGSILIAVLYGTSYGWTMQVYWVIVAGTAGNLFDSFLGATLEQRGYLPNDAVNFLNTLLGALVGLALYWIF